MPTLTIPVTVLPVGARDFGPGNVQNQDSQVVLTIDRTVGGGLNAAPGAAVEVDAMISRDGGSTWALAAGAGFPGGQVDGTLPAASSLTVGLDQYPGTGRRIKATVTVSGAAVAVAGTLTTS